MISDRNFFYHHLDIQRFLEEKGSFLSREFVNTLPFSEFLLGRCKSYNVNPRMILSLLDLRVGLVARKDRPEEQKLSWCLGMVPNNSRIYGLDYCKGLSGQIEAALSMLVSYYREGRFNSAMPLKFGSEELVGLNPASYALVQFLWLVDRDLESLKRFPLQYAKLHGNDPNRGPAPTSKSDKDTPDRRPRVPRPAHSHAA